MATRTSWRDRLRSGRAPSRRTLFALGAVAVLLIIAAIVFDWNWLRAPLESRIANSTGRDVAIGAVDGGWERGPSLVLRDVVIGADDAPGAALFRAEQLTFVVTPAPLLRGELRLTEVRLSNSEINLFRGRDGIANWVSPRRHERKRQPDDVSEPLWKRVHIGALALDNVVMKLRDEKLDLEARARVDTLPADQKTERWTHRVAVSGRYGRSAFGGEAFTGPFITLRDTGTPFPFRARVDVARTRVEGEGSIADLLGDTSIDSRIVISGPTLSALYPTLSIVLPSTPPYRIEGRLLLSKRLFRMNQIVGRIGRSDLRGDGQFDLRGERPTLTGTLLSERLALADLGAAIGIPQGDETRAPDARVFPDADFDVPRLNAMDADMTLTARRLLVRPELPLEDLKMRIVLERGVLTLRPLQFGFAGGEIVSTVTIDATRKPLVGEAAVDFRRVQFARLFPTLDTERVSAGELGAQVRLTGRGQSVASLLGSAQGTIAAAMSGGRISHTVVAAASLDGGKLLPLLMRGDEPVALRCVAVSMVVEQGIARTQQFVVDAETARVDARGAIDLGNERLALEIESKPKQPSILSVRAPINVEGTFRDPRIVISSGTLLRGGAAVALGVLNPLAALIPLIETGPGEDANCARALAPVEPAAKQAKKATDQPPPVSGKTRSGAR